MIHNRVRFIRLLVLAVCSLCALSSSPRLLAQEAEKNLKVFDALWQKVNDKYFDPKFNGVDWAKMKVVYRPKAAQAQNKQALLEVLQQMLGELKTSHLRASIAGNDRTERQQTGRRINSKDDSVGLGTGFLFRKIEDRYIVYRVLDDSSAQKVGVQIGWLVTHRNEEPFPPRQAGERREGQSVNFRFLDADGQERNLALTYQWVVIKPQLISRMLNGNVAYIKFDKFASDTDKWLARQLARYQAARGMIVDLRGNPGGYVETLHRCLDQFYEKKTIVGMFEGRDGHQAQLNVGGLGQRTFVGPLVILVDEASESSAEIFAAAVRDTDRGKVLGRQTAGKALSATTEKLPEGFQLLIAIHNYRTVRGESLEGNGVKPDVAVALKLNAVRRQHDPDLERAMELFK